MNKNDAMIRASGYFLTKKLPEDWEDWEEDRQDTFVTDNAWQPFEFWESGDIWEEIDRLSDEFIKISEGK